MGRGYGRDFGAAGRNQGFDGSHGQGYGGSLAPSDYRERFGGEAYGGGTAAADYERSQGGRGGSFGGEGRSWMDLRAEANMRSQGPHQGRGPQGWRRSDERVREEICERLTDDVLIDARGIEVEVREGVVTLSGEAVRPSDPTLASQIAHEVSGVKDVRVELTVKPRDGGSTPRPSGEEDRAGGGPPAGSALPT
jgi:hypothetical protein